MRPVILSAFIGIITKYDATSSILDCAWRPSITVLADGGRLPGLLKGRMLRDSNFHPSSNFVEHPRVVQTRFAVSIIAFQGEVLDSCRIGDAMIKCLFRLFASKLLV